MGALTVGLEMVKEISVPKIDDLVHVDPEERVGSGGLRELCEAVLRLMPEEREIVWVFLVAGTDVDSFEAGYRVVGGIEVGKENVEV